ncbi:hypothetical protein [Stackebrandtia nassauensis]|uniref:hypothetical protein n=1 Tax=Stackebrandtia nassauensis TaxID=283811 RepID=UPI0011856D0B|nr:hypothetical protein [Stackebrandtia nassauensis]
MRIFAAISLFTLATVALTGCGSGSAADTAKPSPSPAPAITSDRAPIGTSSAAGELAGLAAAAKGRDYSATYELTRPGDKPVEVSVELAADDRWSVEVPGGAQGGKADVTIARHRDFYVQCVEGKRDSCARVDTKDDKIPSTIDPVVQHVFTDWLDVMINRSSPISVAYAEDVKGVAGQCFWLERNSVTVSSPIPSGVYCLRSDGIVTAAKASFGSLKLKGEPGSGPGKLTLPDADEDATPLGTSPPPKPSPSKSKSKKPQ